jgi:hypothetical protein
MATKTLGNKKNNRYIWERGNIIVGSINIEAEKHSEEKSKQKISKSEGK